MTLRKVKSIKQRVSSKASKRKVEEQQGLGLVAAMHGGPGC